MVHKLRFALPAVLILIAAAVIVRPWGGDEPQRTAAALPRRGRARGRGRARRRSRPRGARPRGQHGRSAASALYAGPRAVEPPCGDHPGHPESFADLAQANSARAARSVAPGTPPEARRLPRRRRAARRAAAPRRRLDAVRQHAADRRPHRLRHLQRLHARGPRRPLGPRDLPRRRPVRRPHLRRRLQRRRVDVDRPRRLVDADRRRAADAGRLRRSRGRRPTAARSSSSPATTPSAATRSPGLGVYRTTDLGAHWTHATGVPDGVLGFKLAVDQTHPSGSTPRPAAACSARPTRGASFANVNLPTGDAPAPTARSTDARTASWPTSSPTSSCRGRRTRTRPANAKPGAVLAAVGWRAGHKANADGSQQSPSNGMYGSDTGEPGTFTNLDFAGQQHADRAGRLARRRRASAASRSASPTAPTRTTASSTRSSRTP